MARQMNQFDQLADRLQILTTKNKAEEETISTAEIMEMSFEDLKHEKITFGKAHLGRTFPDMLSETGYLTWFTRSYKHSQKPGHVKFLRFLQLHVEMLEATKASTTAKSAPKSKAKAKGKGYLGPICPEDLPVPDGFPMPEEDEDFPSWETVHMDENVHLEMQDLKDRLSNLESMLSQVVDHLSKAPSVSPQ